jgi:energy-coupling factor transporter ATP-binding protein EcfA2
MGRREVPLDSSAGPVEQLAHALRELRANAGGPTYRAMAARAAFSASSLAHAASGRALPSLSLTLAYAEACGGDREEWESRWAAASQELARTPRDDDGADPPYRGLESFEPSDRELFFGRDDLVERVVDLMGRRRFVALVGASGSGKSSLLRAGILPALRERPAGAPRLAAVRVMTPGGRPTNEQAAVLTAVPTAGTGEVLLVVDQFEEVFARCPERQRFLDLLLTALDEDSRLRVVIAVRADFLGRCAEHPRLAAALRDATVVVGAMSAAELREAVVKPAAGAGLIVERSLTARIVEEAVREPGGLPLMSHALLETWRRRRGRALTEEMYDAAGGIHGAVARTAEDFFRRLTPAQAGTARRILLRLITPGEGTEDTRRPTDRAELDAASPETAAVLEQLVRARLLTLDGRRVDLAHEALISAWPRYRAWIDQERGRLRLHRRLTDAARTWVEHDHDPDTLYRGRRLAAAADAFAGEARQALSSREAAFLDAGGAARDHESREAARTARRLRHLTIALSVVLVIAFTAGLAAWHQGRAAACVHPRIAAPQQAALSRQLAAERMPGAMVTAGRGDGAAGSWQSAWLQYVAALMQRSACVP